MAETEAGSTRWAVYAERVSGGWILRGIYPTQMDADRHGRYLRPRIVVPISLRGRPPERFADQAALEQWFGVQRSEDPGQ